MIIFMIHESSKEKLEIIEEHPETIASKSMVAISLKYDKPDFINQRELRYGNSMYDIVYMEYKDGDTILYCVNDKKETELHTAFRSLNELNDNPASVPDHLASTILKNLLKNYLPNPNNQSIKNFSSRRYCLISFHSIPSVIPEKNYPPPQHKIISC